MFSTDYEVNEDTGEVTRVGKTRQTLRTRISALIKKAASNREDFRNRERSLIGPIARLWLLLWNDIGLGLIAPLAVGTGQPVLTIANVAGSLGAAALSALPVVPVLEWVTHAALFNMDPNQRDPGR